VSQVDVEEQAPGRERASEVAWSPAPVIKRRAGRRDRTGMLVAITLAGVAVATIKPWGIGAPAATDAAVPAVAGPSDVVHPVISAAPPPTPAPVIADPNAMTCLTHQVEQVLTLERWPDREIKSWSQASGGVVTVSSSHVVGVGVCPGIGPAVADPPNADAGRNPLLWGAAVVTDVRRLDGAKPMDLGRPARITEQADYVAAGVLYGAPIPDVTIRAPAKPSPPGPAWRQGATGDLPAWPAGRYEIRYFFPGDPDTAARSLLLEISTPLNDR
jgi:hypothetical protein